MEGQHCTNCAHGREKSTFKNCMDCLKDSTRDNPFPGWEPQKKQGYVTGHTAVNLISTSVEDCKAHMPFITDIDLLRETLEKCQTSGHKTRAQIVSRRIRQLEVAA